MSKHHDILERCNACGTAYLDLHDDLACPRCSGGEVPVLPERLVLTREELDALVERYMPLVHKFVNRYKRFAAFRGLEEDDLLQEGRMGLMEAAERYDPRRENKFMTVAVWWIRHHIQQAVDEAGVVRCPVHTQGKKPKNLSDQQWVRTIELSQKAMTVCSLNKMIGTGHDGDEFASLVSDKRQLFREPDTSTARLEEAMATLSPRHRLILEYRYGLNFREVLSLVEIGEILGVTKERVRQLEVKAMGKLKRLARRQRWRE